MNIEDTLRQIIREELERLEIGPSGGRLAYSVAELAAATGISSRQMYKHVERRDLSPVYSGTKVVIPVAEAERFLASLPDEDRGPLL
ncbi:helix-turn-helix domain-containing protein [Microbacterium sp. AGC62]